MKQQSKFKEYHIESISKKCLVIGEKSINLKTGKRLLGLNVVIDNKETWITGEVYELLFKG